jgi:uncharacterized membrane protein YqjE
MNTHATEPRYDDTARAAAARPTLAALFSNLWRQTTTLVSEEAELAKTEMSEKADQAISGAALIVAGGAVIFAGFLALLVAATNALVMWLPPEHASWLAPLIVGAVVLVIGFIALASGRSELKARNLAPTRTLRSLRRDGRIVKEHLQ